MDPLDFDPNRHEFPHGDQISQTLEEKVSMNASKIRYYIACLFAIVLTMSCTSRQIDRVIAPTSTPTPSPTPEPDPYIAFDDPFEDTFDRNSMEPYNDPISDIIGVDIRRGADYRARHHYTELSSVEGSDGDFVIIVSLASALPATDYSFAIIVKLVDDGGETRTFIYQIHDGQQTIGEINPETYEPLDTGVEVINLPSGVGSGELAIFLPAESITGMTSPFTVFVESFHMTSSESVLSGDDAGYFGPFVFP